ncbi:IS30 family transposase [Bombilactobacillus bombi]|uniref:IS30 family transposase n=1 Tax=Bombilactobacillus bombi TaxID=1303590 RepID=A0A3R6YNU3_9LACO|nr:IS30 family transposase [Bombilactobacillus bombi]RHW52088.1 IS30 family transposase [Bombilactobacillus bombi]
MSTSTLTQFDRGAIALLWQQGQTQQQIADAVGVAKSTICTELQRVKPYDPILAQQDADQKRQHCGRKTILNASLKQLIENHLRLTWSPEAIAAKFKVAPASIYNWLHQGQLDFDCQDLPDRNRRRQRSQETRGQYQTGTSIEQRPAAINQRQAFGHWEVDTVLSSRGQSKTCLVTFVERHSRFFWAMKAPNRTAQSLNQVFASFMHQFGSTVQSITVDHGKEFAQYQDLERDYGLTTYFCHPYSPWERGSNEYFNRKLRWFFPKQTNFNQVTAEQVLEAVELINNRPLKLHHYRTAIEVFRACSD